MKELLFILGFIFQCSFLFSQNIESFTDICKKLTHIDSSEYKRAFKKPKSFTKSKFKKIKGAISIETATKKEIFRDDKRINSYATYSVLGEDTALNWAIVIETHENDEDAYIISLKTGKQWNLLARPNIYEDKIVCWEAITDSPNRIHILSISGDEITKEEYLIINNCDANFWDIQRIFYSNHHLYFKDMKNNYFKAKLDF